MKTTVKLCRNFTRAFRSKVVCAALVIHVTRRVVAHEQGPRYNCALVLKCATITPALAITVCSCGDAVVAAHLNGSLSCLRGRANEVTPIAHTTRPSCSLRACVCVCAAQANGRIESRGACLELCHHAGAPSLRTLSIEERPLTDGRIVTANARAPQAVHLMIS